MPNAADTPMTKSFVTELDGTKELVPDGIQFYQEMIGMLMWST